VPAPGEGDAPVAVGADLVLGAYFTGGFPREPYAKELRRDTVELWLRASSSPAIFEAEKPITDAIIDKRNWLMGDLLVIESEQWRPLTPFDRSEQAFTFTVSYWFETYG
jgi:hypothetical protein